MVNHIWNVYETLAIIYEISSHLGECDVGICKLLIEVALNNKGSPKEKSNQMDMHRGPEVQKTMTHFLFVVVKKALLTHPSKLLEFYLPQAYDLQPKTLCKESKD